MSNDELFQQAIHALELSMCALGEATEALRGGVDPAVALAAIYEATLAASAVLRQVTPEPEALSAGV